MKPDEIAELYAHFRGARSESPPRFLEFPVAHGARFLFAEMKEEGRSCDVTLQDDSGALTAIANAVAVLPMAIVAMYWPSEL